MRKRILSLLTALVLCLGLLPVTAGAADISSTGLEIDVESLTTEPVVYQAGGGTITVSLSADGTTLSAALDSVTIDTTENVGISFGSFAATNVTAVRLTLSGTNQITAAKEALCFGQGKFHQGTEITISGGGTLSICSGVRGIVTGNGGYDDKNTLIFQSGSVDISGGGMGLFLNSCDALIQGTASVTIQNASSSGVSFYWNDNNWQPTCGLTVREQGSLKITGTSIGVHALCQGGTDGASSPQSYGGYIRVEGSGSLQVEASQAGLYANQMGVSGGEVQVSLLGGSALAGILAAGSDLRDGEPAVNLTGGTVSVHTSGQGGVWAKSSDVHIGGSASVVVTAQERTQPVHTSDTAEQIIEGAGSLTALLGGDDSELGPDGKIILGENGTVTVTNTTADAETVTTITAPASGGTVSVDQSKHILLPGGSTIQKENGEELTVPDEGGELDPASGNLAKKKYTVIFAANGGSAVGSQEVEEGGRASKPADPTKEGFDFGGWYTDEGCTTAYDFTAAVTEDITLYAKWTPKPVTPPTPPAPPSAGPSLPSGGGSSDRDDDDDDDDDVPPSQAAKVSVKNPDGSTTITDRKTGTVTTVTRAPDGTEVTVTADSGGRVISAEASVPKGTAVLPAGPGLGTEMKITVKGGGKSQVTIPLGKAGPGVVAVLAGPGGGERVDRKSAVTAEGVVLTVRGSAVVRLEDRGRSFPDVPGGWKAEAAAFVSARGILNGGTDGRFRPDAPMTRAMLAAALYNLEGNPAPEGSGGFSDVPSDAWCADAVAWAAIQGVVGGYDGGVFRPNAPITREQLAVMLWRYAGSPAPGPGAALNFSDADAVGDYARQALLWAVEKGILSGYGDGRLDPKGAATRVQAARMVQNFMSM